MDKNTEIPTYTIPEIIDLCEGAAVIAAATDKTTSAVHKWKANGIHDSYWPTLIHLSDGQLTVEILFQANVRVREKAT